MYLGIAKPEHRVSPVFDPVNVPQYYLGPLGVGAVNLTSRVPPPIKPQPELEQGVGRAPVNAWAHQEHIIHDNPDWYLGVGALFQPADFGTSGAGNKVPIPWPTQIALTYYQNQELQNVPGAMGAPGVMYPVTVPGGVAVTQTRRAVL